jgi:hypothetical protein
MADTISPTKAAAAAVAVDTNDDVANAAVALLALPKMRAAVAEDPVLYALTRRGDTGGNGSGNVSVISSDDGGGSHDPPLRIDAVSPSSSASSSITVSSSSPAPSSLLEPSDALLLRMLASRRGDVARACDLLNRFRARRHCACFRDVHLCSLHCAYANLTANMRLYTLNTKVFFYRKLYFFIHSSIFITQYQHYTLNTKVCAQLQFDDVDDDMLLQEMETGKVELGGRCVVQLLSHDAVSCFFSLSFRCL